MSVLFLGGAGMPGSQVTGIQGCLDSGCFWEGSLDNSAEAHERHGEQTGSEQSDRCALHTFRHLVELELLADAGEEDECQRET